MRIPLSWLREYTEFPAEATAEDLMADLVRVGLEEEDVHRPSDSIHGPIVVGRVLSKEPEPQSNGKTINWCQVDVGNAEPQGIVCGAHNFDVGDKVVVTMPGSTLPGDFTIAARKTYGHVSAGMIASVRELGIGEDHDGILVLSTIGLDPEIGEDALALLGLTDEAAEINVTPDRGYCFSVRGVAREYSHATGTAFTDPARRPATPASLAGGYPVRLADDAPIYDKPGCDRFVARTVRGVDVAAPTPTWMSSRLRLAGIRSISLIVDVTNYVMLELGQPLHAYDLDGLAGDIVVRRAGAGEKLETLDGTVRKLSTEDLLITDDSGPIGIAGVMGGADTEVSATTTNVLIEAAHFEEVGIARSARRHRLPSEASKRFERGVDRAVAPAAAQRAAELLVALGAGTLDDAGTDIGTAAGAAAAQAEIHLPSQYASERIGMDISAEQIIDTLTQLGAEVDTVEDGFRVTAPSWRPDLVDKADLSEEVARLIGYDLIPSRLPIAPPGRGLTRVQQQRRMLAGGLADAGLVEVKAYPFVSEQANAVFGTADAGTRRPALRLANPLSAEEPFLRLSLLPGLLAVAKRNVSRGFKDLSLFETGLVYHPGESVGSASIPPLGIRPADDVLDGLLDGIPDQPEHVAAVLTGNDSAPGAGHTPRPWDWADALDVARGAADLVGVDVVVEQGTHQAFHPGRTARLSLRSGEVIGYAGELHPKLLAAWDAPARTVAVELDAGAVYAAAPDVIVSKHISTYPVATQDVALVVAEDLPAAQVLDTLREGAGELLEDVSLFDVYAGAGIDDGKKSLAFGLRFRAPDRTLTAEEATVSREAAVALAAERHGAIQRA